MTDFSALLAAFGTMFTPANLLTCFAGSFIGVIVGALPGIGSLAGVALLLPLTFKFNPIMGISLLSSIYYSDMYGGAFSAILLNIPGDGPAIMTALDGYPIARSGKPGKALMTATLSSFIGGLIGMAILAFSGPILAKFGIRFGPVEMTSLMIMALGSISWIMGEDPVKGLLTTMFGFIIATMGVDTLTGMQRFSFGSYHIMGGINFTPLCIGLFGFSQVLEMMEDRRRQKERAEAMVTKKLTYRDSLLTGHEVKRILPPAVRSGFLGTFIGVLPGSGATASSFLCYALQKAFKSEKKLGEGALEGVAASEAANNAASAGAFAPMLSLGIPGSASTAIMMGGLMAWGLKPGPLLFTNSPDFAWSTIASLLIANVLTLIIAFLIIPLLQNVLRVPIKYMIPFVTVICFIGAYSVTFSMYHVLIMIIAGLVGYFFKKNHYPLAPILLAVVLCSLFELNMRRAFTMSNNDISVFVNHPISLAFLIIFVLMMLINPIRSLIKRIRGGSAAKKG